MTKLWITLAAAAIFSAPAMAQEGAMAPAGDVAAGEAAFNKQCKACHVVRNDAGEVLAGKKARTGPNLFGIANRQAGSIEGFRFGKSLITAGADSGLVWDEETFIGFVQDPTGYLRAYLEDPRARAKMSFKVKKEDDAANLYAFLFSLAPPPVK